MSDIQFLSRKEVMALFKISHSTLHKWRSPTSYLFKSDFPKPIKIGQRLLWVHTELMTFIELEQAKRDRALNYREEIRSLKNEIKASILTTQKAQKDQYIRPPKGERLGAHTLRKLQALGMR